MNRPDLPSSTAFDVREFARTAAGSHRAHLDLGAYAAAPLDHATLEIVALLARLERGALSYLRSVLVTPTHKDARVTGFLVTWAYEKFWVADALELIVAAHPGDVPTPSRGVPRLRKAWHAVAERLEPIRESVVANLIGDDVIAVHTAAGAIDEWITQAVHDRLIADSTSPTFTATLTRLLDVKVRHSAYFAEEARERLAASASAVPLARRRLRGATWPLGAADEPPALVARLFGEVIPASGLAALDARVDDLPGLAGLHLVTTAAQRARKAAR